MIACKFFNDHRKVCWWANEKKSHIDIISVTFVPGDMTCNIFGSLFVAFFCSAINDEED